MSENNIMLTENIENFDEITYEKQLKQLQKSAIMAESGEASARVCDFISRYMD